MKSDSFGVRGRREQGRKERRRERNGDVDSSLHDQYVFLGIML